MITLITGGTGTSKTLFMVNMIVKKLIKEGRPIFTDIDSLDLSVLDGITPEQLDLIKEIPPPHPTDPDQSYHDFRDLPQGSIIIYDEAHKRFPSTGKSGPSRFDCVRALDTHRHDGYDIFYITQTYLQIDKKLRDFVNRHYHIERKRGLEYATVYMVENKIFDPSDRHHRREAEGIPFKYPKSLYGTYKSAPIHTARVVLPKKLIFFLLAMGFLIWWVWSNANDSAIIKSWTGISDGSLISDKSTTPSLKPQKKSKDESYQPEAYVDDKGFTHTTYLPDTLYMSIVGRIGGTFILEIGQPPESYQISHTELIQAGAEIVVENDCTLYMAYHDKLYKVTCGLHERFYPAPKDPVFTAQPETNLNPFQGSTGGR